MGQTGSTSFRFRHYTMNDGLSSNSIRSILQDRRGYIWLGTECGLNCFDGIQVKDYTLGGSDHPGNNTINAMLEDEEGTIWLATDIGVFSFLPDKEIFQRLNAETEKEITAPSIVYAITQDRDKNLWFATYGQGVLKYNRKNNTLTRFDIPNCSNNVYCVYADSDNLIWATGNSSYSASVYRLNKSNNHFEEFPVNQRDGKPFSNTLTIFEDSSRSLWLGTKSNGLQRVDRYSGEVATYLSPSSGNGIKHIHSVYEYSPQSLLVGSDDGLSLFHVGTGEHKRFLPEKINPFSLSNQFVYPIIKDREGGIWIGTYYGGVNYISPSNNQFESFAHTDYANSVCGAVISRFCEDRNGDIWIGSDDGGLSCYSPKTGRFTNFMPIESKNSLSYHNVHALCFDGEELWIGTYSGGLNVLNTRTGKFRLYSASDHANDLDQNSIYAIFKDRENTMWVASMTGLHLYDRQKDHFIRIKEFGYLTLDIKQDVQGNLWFATQGKGVFRYNPAKGVWKNYVHSEQEYSLTGNMVNCIHVDAYGDIWIGTTDGLCKYNAQKEGFDRVQLAAQNQNICCIIEEEHQFWITTSKGLIHYTPDESCRVFTHNDGLQNDQFLPCSGIKASNGKIYIGSINGFSTFYPHRIRPNAFVPPVVLTDLEIFNKRVQISADGVLSGPLNQLKQLDLSYRDNVFSICYAGLSYCIPQKNEYAYLLEGFDKAWNYVGTQHKATYTNLPAGTYLFKVKASNNDGVWNDTGTQLKIVIHPPFYLATPFKLIYFFLLVFGFALLFRFFIRRTEKKHEAEIAELNRLKEKEMHEAKINFFTMIAHEIRTPVSLIIGPLEKIMTSASVPIPPALHSDLNVINRNSQRLLFLINQLLDFRKVEREGISLKLEKCLVHELIRTISVRFTPWVTQHGAKFTVEYPDKEVSAFIDREAVTKLISNLLTNAAKYTKDEVVLSCKVAEARNELVLTVSDNGCGIKEEDKERIFQPFYQAADNKPGTGIGLNIVHTIVKAHHGSIAVQSEADKGASFTVTLPLVYDTTEYPDTTTERTEEYVPEDIITLETTGEDGDVKPAMLIVDDNDDMLNFLSDSFTDEYNVFTASDGKEALKELHNNKIVLIVADWMMPNMSGIELCKAVRSDQATSHIPFILLTAKSDIHAKIEGMDCGADAYIEKPFSLQYLRSRIKNLIDLREMLYQKFSKMPLMPLKSVAVNRADEEFLARMNGIIEGNFFNPDLSIDYLADKLCISRSGLFAKIKTLTNVTPNELIQVVRLKKAAALLAENKYRINEISYMVGFNNPSYFSKCFQKQFGVKPGEFIKGAADKN